MKSAYEKALEMLDEQGIERPSDEAISESLRAQIEDEKSKAEAKLAELEILHRKSASGELDANYLRERQRIEGALERRLRELRSQRHAD